jgi:hypothetical protein
MHHVTLKHSVFGLKQTAFIYKERFAWGGVV